jgi:hypothetical protein
MSAYGGDERVEFADGVGQSLSFVDESSARFE